MGSFLRSTGLIALLVNLMVVASAQRTIEYTVKEGDSLYAIAHRFGLRLPDLLKVNRLRNPHKLKPGDVIRIPVKGAVAAQTVLPASGWMEINKDRVNIRQGAGTHTKRITIVDRWTKVKVLGRQGDWRRVQLVDGREGWVLAKYLSPTRPPKRLAAASSARRQLARRNPSRTAALRELSDRANPLEASASDGSGTARRVLEIARRYLGRPYRYGGSSSRGFDCSGFALHVYRSVGVNLPHSASAQARLGKPVPRDQLKPGDLVFFRTRGRRISHVGIYLGNGKFIHASSSRGRVRIDSLNEGYYKRRYAGARRISR